jgi:hypothetical protein
MKIMKVVKIFKIVEMILRMEKKILQQKCKMAGKLKKM